MEIIKFRAWHKGNEDFVYASLKDFWKNGVECVRNGAYSHEFKATGMHDSEIDSMTFIPNADWEQYTGLKDNTEKEEWYHNDIGEFDNGDKFIIKCEEWLEFYVEWIGEPECEDQARDFYRIENAKKIGNIHKDNQLIKG